MTARAARLAVDIGGTFTDVALEAGGALRTRKVLTTPRAPEEGVMQAIAAVMPEAGVQPADIALVIHGTTLATNAIIERKGAKTALIVTEGFRDSVEMAYENRFEQYDIDVEKPQPLVPRYLRLPVTERLNAAGEVLVPLDEASVEALVPTLRKHGVESVAVGLLHAYANGAHEARIGEMLRAALPDIWISLASEVSPEIREYERQSTVCANAYVQPLMANYLGRLDEQLKAQGFACPLFMMMSGGGLTTVETARRFPIRLVESGPAGGAILASQVAMECGLDEVLSFDMGGTTAKICLIDDGRPQASRVFEVDRVHRFTKGSGLPLRIPVIEMVEIGAGGGSIARLDALSRIGVGPDSAGSEPGPACYGRGGSEPTVTDADVVLGRIDPASFAGGAVALDVEASAAALANAIGDKLNLDRPLAAFGVSEVVDENMANAARVHAIERGKDVASRALVAFGGAAPLHAARLAEKLNIDTVIVPTGAGVGSAIGFLRAPVGYEVVRSRYTRLSSFDLDGVNEMFAAMQAEAREIVEQGAQGQPITESRICYMRYVGQGHEIDVAVPVRALDTDDVADLQTAFDARYTELYGRTIPGVDVEILTWASQVTTEPPRPEPAPAAPAAAAPDPRGRARLFDPGRTDYVDVPVYRRDDLAKGASVGGPCLITEDQTTTVVAAGFTASVDGLGYLVLARG
ncbi:MAG: hydantoinase/oxoprolinase family protein [Alphaproteobacteria bacterium]